MATAIDFLSNLFNNLNISEFLTGQKPAQEKKRAPMKMSKPPIRKAAVIGAGVMGAGIAAQLANAGIEVVLLDKFEGTGEKSIARMLKATPQTDPMNAGFMAPENSKLITTGTTDNDMDKIADADWIIEVVIENIDVKQSLFTEIEKHRKPGSIVSSNTSTIPLSTLTEKLSDKAREDYMITHFFNPVRFMPLVELVVSDQTRANAKTMIAETCDKFLGKNIINCNDTPGFIGNRVGAYMLKRALNEAIDRDMNIEDVDAVMGPPMGFPKMGIFALMDTVGLDIGRHVTESQRDALPKEDAFQKIAYDLPLLANLIDNGRTGKKSAAKEGFYRRTKEGKESIDLKTGEYRAFEKSTLKSPKAGRKGLRAVFETDDAGGALAWEVMRDTLVYTASLLPEISDNIMAVDEAMRYGYNWKRGPFEMIDAMGNDNETGVDWFIGKLEEENIEVPDILRMAAGRSFYAENGAKKQYLSLNFDEKVATYQNMPQSEGVLDLADVKRASKPLLQNSDVSLWDLGDGVVCAELHGMKQTLGPDTVSMLNDSMDLIAGSKGKYNSLVIYSDKAQFAVGANLGLAAMVMNMANYDKLDDIVYDGQKTLERLKYAPFPVVSAVGGMALGGGCEILLHSDAIQAHAEAYIGLVETGVGLLPAWGGCKEFLGRCFDNFEKNNGNLSPELRAFETLSSATVSSSGQDAKNKLFMRKSDGVTMNRSRLLADAKEKAQHLTHGYKPPTPYKFKLSGPGGKAIMDMGVDDMRALGIATWHDARVASVLATALTGNDTNPGRELSEEDILTLERKGFLRLASTAQTRKRIQTTVNTSRPLREKPLEVPQSGAELRDSVPDVAIKERASATPWSKETPSAAPAPSDGMPDTSKMKPMDAIIAVIKHDAGITDMRLPEDGDADALGPIFNEAAAQTQERTLDGLNKSKGMASLLPGKALKKRVMGDFEKRIEKGEMRLTDTTDPEAATKLMATIETMKHYKNLIQNLDM